MISIYRGQYTVYVTSPLDTRLQYRQQFFLAPTIVAFRRSILATKVSEWMQAVIILLQ